MPVRFDLDDAESLVRDALLCHRRLPTMCRRAGEAVTAQASVGASILCQHFGELANRLVCYLLAVADNTRIEKTPEAERIAGCQDRLRRCLHLIQTMLPSAEGATVAFRVTDVFYRALAEHSKRLVQIIDLLAQVKALIADVRTQEAALSMLNNEISTLVDAAVADMEALIDSTDDHNRGYRAIWQTVTSAVVADPLCRLQRLRKKH